MYVMGITEVGPYDGGSTGFSVYFEFHAPVKYFGYVVKFYDVVIAHKMVCS